jgi:hypothetical protein
MTNHDGEAQREVLDALMLGQEQFDEWARANPSKLQPGLAAALDARGDSELERGRYGHAAHAFMGATQVWQHLDRFVESTRSVSMYVKSNYMYSSDPSEYAQVRPQAIAVEQQAKSLNLNALGFELRVVAADSAFWAAEGVERGSDKTSWIVHAIGDLVLAAKDAPPDTPVLQFASVAAAVAYRAMGSTAEENVQRTTPLLMELARATERLVPVNFVFPDNRDTTRSIATHLAALSNEFGNPNVAARRLAFVTSLR